MARGKTSILGIHIQPYRISVVEVQGEWLNWRVLRCSDTVLRECALTAEGALNSAVVTPALQNLLSSMRVANKDAVLCIPNTQIITRQIDLPRIPDDDLREIVESELSYSLTSGDPLEAYDFLKLPEPQLTEESMQPTLILGMERAVAQQYMTLVSQCGLRLRALEPATFSMYRATVAQFPSQDMSIWVGASADDMELALSEAGYLRFYRQLDTKFALDVLDANSPPTLEMNLSDVQDGQTRESKTPHERSTDALLLEIQRSYKYYQHKTRSDRHAQEMRVATMRDDADLLVETFEQRFGIATHLVDLEPFAADFRALGVISPLERRGYLAAFGAALHVSASIGAPETPLFNLTLRKREDKTLVQTRSRLSLSLVAAIVFALAGTFFSLKTGFRANHMDHEVAHLKEELEELKQARQEKILKIQTERRILDNLLARGFAFPRVMDALSQATTPFVGLTEVSVEPDGRISLNGEAAEEKGVIAALQGLKQSPLFIASGLDSFDRNTSNHSKEGSINFHISTQIAGMGQIETKGANTP